MGTGASDATGYTSTTTARRWNCSSRAARQARQFSAALESTVRWYVDNQAWWRRLQDADYRRYYERNYADRAHLLAGSSRGTAQVSDANGAASASVMKPSGVD